MTTRFLCIISIFLIATLPSWSADNDEVFIITNETGFTIAALYISDINSEVWGKNLLDKNPLLEGESLSIPLLKLESLTVRVKARDDEGDTYTVFDINAVSEDISITLNHIDPD